MFLRLFFIETRKTFKHPALWIGLAALVLLLGGFTLLSHHQIAYGHKAASGGLERDLISGLQFYSWIGVLVYAVTGAVIAAFDYPDRSIQIFLNRGVPRSTLLFARLVTILFFGLLLAGFTLAALLGLGSLSRLLYFGAADAANLNVAALLPALLRLFWSGIPYLGLTVLLAVVSRSPLAAACGTIFYGCIFESLALTLGEPYRRLVEYLPVSLGRVIQAASLGLDRSAVLLPASALPVPELQAALLIGLIFLAAGSLSFVIFSRQNLGG